MSPMHRQREAAVIQAARRFVGALEGTNLEELRSIFDEEAVAFLPSEHEPRRLAGRDAIADAFIELFERWRAARSAPPFVDIEPVDPEVTLLDDVAVLTFHLDERVRFGRRTMVFRRRADQWRIIHLHASNGARPADART